MAQLLACKGADPDLPMPSPEEIINTRLRDATEDESAGVAVLAAHDGKVLFQRRFGYSSLEHGVLPVTPTA